MHCLNVSKWYFKLSNLPSLNDLLLLIKVWNKSNNWKAFTMIELPLICKCHMAESNFVSSTFPDSCVLCCGQTLMLIIKHEKWWLTSGSLLRSLQTGSSTNYRAMYGWNWARDLSLEQFVPWVKWWLWPNVWVYSVPYYTLKPS